MGRKDIYDPVEDARKNNIPKVTVPLNPLSRVVAQALSIEQLRRIAKAYVKVILRKTKIERKVEQEKAHRMIRGAILNSFFPNLSMDPQQIEMLFSTVSEILKYKRQ